MEAATYIEEDGTVAIAYLKTTEQRIIDELRRETGSTFTQISEKIIVAKMELERSRVRKSQSPHPVQEGLINLLNVIEERLKLKDW